MQPNILSKLSVFIYESDLLQTVYESFTWLNIISGGELRLAQKHPCNAIADTENFV